MPSWAWFLTGLFIGGTVGLLIGGLCNAAARGDEQGRPGYNPPRPAEEGWPKPPPGAPLGRRPVLGNHGYVYSAVRRKEED